MKNIATLAERIQVHNNALMRTLAASSRLRNADSTLDTQLKQLARTLVGYGVDCVIQRVPLATRVELHKVVASCATFQGIAIDDYHAGYMSLTQFCQASLSANAHMKTELTPTKSESPAVVEVDNAQSIKANTARDRAVNACLQSALALEILRVAAASQLTACEVAAEKATKVICGNVDTQEHFAHLNNVLATPHTPVELANAVLEAISIVRSTYNNMDNS